jgi:CPA1 family monovalent cation:H+ antiporter
VDRRAGGEHRRRLHRPFVAYLPTEHLGGSGLVAAVAAGITAGQGAARWSTPEQRVSDELNWHTLELLLEGAVFLIMGLELRDIVSANVEKHSGVGVGIGLALAALAIVHRGAGAVCVWAGDADRSSRPPDAARQTAGLQRSAGRLRRREGRPPRPAPATGREPEPAPRRGGLVRRTTGRAAGASRGDGRSARRMRRPLSAGSRVCAPAWDAS